MFQISYTLDASLVTKRAHGQIMRDVNRAVLERWRDRYLPRHFQGGASNRYGYEPRTSRYTARKRKKYGHSIPLVYTGRLRDEIKQRVKITATQHRGNLKSRGYFPMKQVLRSEIERVMPFENEELAQFGRDLYVKLAKLKVNQRQRTRRSSQS